MFQELFGRIIQAFEPPAKKKPSRTKAQAKPASTKPGGERRKTPREGSKDRRRSKLRIQDWNERDTIRRESGNFVWEGYIPKSPQR